MSKRKPSEGQRAARVLQHPDGYAKENSHHSEEDPNSIDNPESNTDPHGADSRTREAHQAAIAFVAANPHAIRELFDWVGRRAARGTHTTQAAIATHLFGRVADSGGDFKVNHNHMPVVVRLLLMAVPEARGYVETRASRFDVFYPELFAQAEPEEADRG